jgi:hypothetical protein
MTLEQIGEQLGVTRERVRQIKERALARLRHVSRARSLESFLGSQQASPPARFLDTQGFHRYPFTLSQNAKTPAAAAIAGAERYGRNTRWRSY